MGFLEKAKKSQWYGVGLLLVITVLCWAVFKVLCPDTFGAPDQLLTYLQTGIIYAVGGCGLYFIVVMGLWDFSIGSVLVLACLLSIGFAQMFGSYPWNLIVALAAFGLCAFILKYTKLGTYVNAIGANELTAKNMGVNVDKYKFFAFVLCSMFVGIMAILYIGYGTAQTPMTGMLSQSLNFKPLMGTFFALAFRKYGHPVVSVVIGEFIIAMMFAGFVALGMPVTVNNIITGATLLIIVCITTKRIKGAVVK